MGWRTLWWSLKCLGYCVLGIFACGQVTLYATRVVWWAMFRSGATHLSYLMFGFEHFFGLRAIYGFILGLVPLSSLAAAIRSMFARFNSASITSIQAEDSWAWLPVVALFLIELILWRPADSSVIATGPTEGRFEHFFNPMAIAIFGSVAPSTPRFVFDLVIITGPMVFLMAYTVGVWLRHQLPSHESLIEETPITQEELSIEPR